MSESDLSAVSEHSGEHRKAALAAWLGSALEYYDFFIYGTAAALVFDRVFFPVGSAALGLLASLASFGVAYVARPLGAVVLGHFGDRIGRKRLLVVTLLTMGGATFLIGCLPGHAQVGGWAPAALVLLRILQGFAVAGEQALSSSVSLEHAPAGRRAFFASFTLGGTQGGFILASLVFLPVSAMPDAQLLSWGWRIPFLVSALVVAAGWWVRSSLGETPVFEQQPQQPGLPLVRLLHRHPRQLVLVVLSSLYAVISTIVSIYALSYGVNAVGLPRPTLLWMLIAANAVGIVATPLCAGLSDRVGRKPVFLAGALGGAALIWPFIWSISSRNVPLIFLFGALLVGVVYSAAGGVGMALLPEQFPTGVRMSGMAVGTQIGFVIEGFAPAIATALAGPKLAHWQPVALFTCAAALVAALGTTAMRETSQTVVDELGMREPARVR
jgi:MFS family permease